MSRINLCSISAFSLVNTSTLSFSNLDFVFTESKSVFVFVNFSWFDLFRFPNSSRRASMSTLIEACYWLKTSELWRYTLDSGAALKYRLFPSLSLLIFFIFWSWSLDNDLTFSAIELIWPSRNFLSVSAVDWSFSDWLRASEILFCNFDISSLWEVVNRHFSSLISCWTSGQSFKWHYFSWPKVMIWNRK